jgi:hypothetical protein
VRAEFAEPHRDAEKKRPTVTSQTGLTHTENVRGRGGSVGDAAAIAGGSGVVS